MMQIKDGNDGDIKPDQLGEDVWTKDYSILVSWEFFITTSHTFGLKIWFLDPISPAKSYRQAQELIYEKNAEITRLFTFHIIWLEAVYPLVLSIGLLWLSVNPFTGSLEQLLTINL